FRRQTPPAAWRLSASRTPGGQIRRCRHSDHLEQVRPARLLSAARAAVLAAARLLAAGQSGWRPDCSGHAQISPTAYRMPAAADRSAAEKNAPMASLLNRLPVGLDSRISAFVAVTVMDSANLKV